LLHDQRTIHSPPGPKFRPGRHRGALDGGGDGHVGREVGAVDLELAAHLMVTSHVKRTNVTTKSKSEYDVGNTYIYIYIYIYIVCVYNMYVILNSIKYIPYLDIYIYIYIIFTNIYIYMCVATYTNS